MNKLFNKIQVILKIHLLNLYVKFNKKKKTKKSAFSLNIVIVTLLSRLLLMYVLSR